MKLLPPIIALLVTVVLGTLVYQAESRRREMKEDLVELLKVKYGIFSVDEWKKILTDLIRKKVDELDVSGGNRDEMRRDITRFLNRAVNDFEAAFHQQKSQTVKGSLESMIAKQLDVFGQVRNYIPTLTEQVLDFMNDPANRDKVKAFVIQKLDEYTNKTFTEVDYSLHDSILKKYSAESREAAISILEEEIKRTDVPNQKYVLLAVIVLFLIWIIFASNATPTEYLLQIGVCFGLLLFGVLLPMIEIDARISSISFTLLGEPISFRDQVLYYKSKSILEVVTLMLRNGRMDVLLVGVLVLMFSVLFPISKLICSVIFLYRPDLRDRRWLNIIVFKTGKWSMADVMVVAIFMAYIGFSGIISDQLRQLQGVAPSLDILTTNQSSLQFGFYLFTSFTVLSLVVAQKMQNSLKIGSD